MFLTQPIPNDYGAALYYSVPPYQTQQFLGCICNQRPFNTFYTWYSLDTNVAIHQVIKIGFQMGKLKNIEMAFKEKI